MSSQQNTSIKLAKKQDVETLVALKKAVWPDESADANRVADALKTRSHQTFIALIDDTSAGFVSCFMTRSKSGQHRWEVDLLAVHPDFRRLGLAKTLVQTAVHAGQTAGAVKSRALIAVGNTGSEKSFAKNGYSTDNEIYTLFISSNRLEAEQPKPQKTHFVHVNTFSYRGIWLEAAFTDGAFLAAQSSCTEDNLDLVGALIRDKEPAVQALAQSLSFEPITQFRWWARQLSVLTNG